MNDVIGGILGLGLMVLILLLFPFAIQFLWNGLMPSIFGLRAISLLEALGLLILCRLLFSQTVSK